MSLALSKLKRRPLTEGQPEKPKKKIDRFDGLTEEEVQKNTLEDILEPQLDLVFVGINPSLMAAHRGRYYAGPGNHFYKLLHASQLVPRFVSFEEDRKLLDYKIGLTNIVARATRSSADLKKAEIKEGAAIAREKIKIFKPRVAVFNGKCIYEVFAEKNAKSAFNFGLQPERVGETAIWVVPSSSARCAHFPRMSDKLHFYTALKKYLSFLKGEIDAIDPAELRFEGKCRQSIPTTSKMWRRKNVSAFLFGGRVANKNTIDLDTSEDNLAAVNSTEFIVTQILGENDQERREKREDSDNEREKNYLFAMGATELHLSSDSSSGDEQMSQRSQNREDISPRETAKPSASPKKEKTLKRRLKRSPVSQLAARASKVVDNDSQYFVNMIKQRLSEKKSSCAENEEKIVVSTCQPIKEAKKLNYANLRSNVGKKTFTVRKDSAKSRSAFNDLDSSAFSD